MARKRAKPPETEENEMDRNDSGEKTGDTSSSTTTNEESAQQDVQKNEREEASVNSSSELSDSFTISLNIPKPVFWTGAIIVAVCAVLIGGYNAYLITLPRFSVHPEIYEDLGVEGIILFRQYDRDDDGVLDIEEFEPLAHRLLEINNGKMLYHYDDETVINETDEVLTIHSFFQPLQLDTMTKDTSHPPHRGGLDSLTGIKKWKTPNKEWENFSARQLAELFMPKETQQITLAETYKITEFVGNAQVQFGAPLSSNRYYPPRLMGSDITLHRLLAMFHPVPFVHMRFAPQGAAACVRAYNDDYLDIVFRIHAEFQLNEPPFYPFWYTPAQFMGQVIISRDSKHLHVEHFRMLVPTDKLLNVDMEWLNGPKESGEMEVDIGFMPQMELRGTSSSHPAIMNGVDMREVNWNDTLSDDDIPDITWTEEVSPYTAGRSLEMFFYPFKKVEYFNITYAAMEAKRLNRPIHHIALWGALDDQSC